MDASETFYSKLGFKRNDGGSNYRILSDGKGDELHLSMAVECWLVPGRNPFGLYPHPENVGELASRFNARAEVKPRSMYKFAISDPSETLVRVGWPSGSGKEGTS